MIDTTIQKYLYDDNSKPVLYDIKNYFAQILQFDITDSNLTKWKKYKSYKTHRYSAYGIDCDVSLLAVQVYQKGWDFLKSIRPTKQYERVKISNLPPLQYRCGDSGEILFSSENIIADEIKEYSICIIREYKYQFILKNESPAEYYRGDTMTSFSNIYCQTTL